MRRYETIVIIDPDLTDEGRAPVLDRVTQLIPQFDGTLILADEWGAKKLAYEIKKKSRGYYVRVDFCGNGALVDEIERHFRIDDRVLKFMTVLLDEDVDPEKILAAIAEEKAAKEEALKAAAPPVPEEKAPAEATAEKAPAENAPAEAPAADTPEPEKTEKTEATDSSEEA